MTSVSATESASPSPIFGPVAALILGVLIAGTAIAAAALSAVFAAGVLHPHGLEAFFLEWESGAVQPNDPSAQLVEGLLYALWGVVLTLLLVVVVAIRGSGIQRTLAIGGSVSGRPLLIAVAIASGLLVAEFVAGEFFPAIRELVKLPTDPLALKFAVFGIVIGAPIGEELLFRGFLYTSLRERWGFKITLAVTAVLFAAAHFEQTGLYALLVLPAGFLIGWLRERTGGVFAPILLHMFFNFATVTYLWLERVTAA